MGLVGPKGCPWVPGGPSKGTLGTPREDQEMPKRAQEDAKRDQERSKMAQVGSKVGPEMRKVAEVKLFKNHWFF